MTNGTDLPQLPSTTAVISERWHHPDLTDEKIDSLDREFLIARIEDFYTTYGFRPPTDYKNLPDDELRTHIRRAARSSQVREVYERRKQELKEKTGVVDSHADAMEILLRGAPVDLMLKVFKKDHAGDTILAKSYIACIGASCCGNTRGLHPGTTGQSGGGKTHSMETILHQIPDEFLFMGSFSDLAFFTGITLPGTIIFLDDAQKMKDIHEEIIKQYTSDYQRVFTRTSTTNIKKRESVKNSIPPRCPVFLNSVDADREMQFLNRQLNLAIDEGHVEEIFKRQLEGATSGRTGFTTDDDWLVAREMWKILKENRPVRVKAPILTEINWKNKDNPRNFPMFFDTVAAHAAIHQYQREKDDDGYIIANKADVDFALQIWSHISREQLSKLNKKELMVMQRIIDLNREMGSQTVERQLLLSGLKKITNGELTHILKGRKQPDGTYKGGLENKVSGLHVERVASKEESSVRTRLIDVIVYTGSLDMFAQFGNIAEWLE